MNMRKVFAIVLAMMLLMTGAASAQSMAAQVKGFGGEIAIEATIEGGKVTALELTGESETPAIGGAAMEKLAEAILAAGTTENVDVVAGATVTSQAVLGGVTALLNEANGIEAAPVKMTAGTYTGEAKGYAGIVTATVTVTEDAITEVVLDQYDNPDSLINTENPMYIMLAVSCRENDSIFLTVQNNLPERIVAAQSTAVDAITGATASSAGALLAVRDALTQAGAGATDFNAPVAKVEGEETYDCDVVVIGGGTSGATAAAQAKELGANVVIIEKSAKLGGTGALSAGPMALNSKQQIEGGYAEDVNKYYEEYDLLMHWNIKGSLFRKMLLESGNTADWLIEHGFALVPDTSWFAETHGGAGRLMAFGALPYIGNAVTEYFDALCKDVDTILYETAAYELITDESGNVVGVKAERYDGTKVTVNAKAVIVATGSFGGSEEIQKRQMDGAAYKLLGLAQNTGDGMEMMLAVGAKEMNASTVCSHAIGVPAEVTGFEAADRAITYNLVTTAALLQVNSQGERFMNEEIQDTDMTRGSVMHSKQGSHYYVLLSQKQVEAIAQGGTAAVGQLYDPTAFSFECVSFPKDQPMTNIQAVLDAACEQNLAYKADTLADMAELIGADAGVLSNTVAEYDAMCEAGVDTAYNKQVSALNVVGEGPYYAVKGTTVIYNALGAVEVNNNCQVMNVNGGLIGGLYATGADSIGTVMDGEAYTNISGINLAWAFGSGRIAAQAAMQAIAE